MKFLQSLAKNIRPLEITEYTYTMSSVFRKGQKLSTEACECGEVFSVQVFIDRFYQPEKPDAAYIEKLYVEKIPELAQNIFFLGNKNRLLSAKNALTDLLDLAPPILRKDDRTFIKPEDITPDSEFRETRLLNATYNLLEAAKNYDNLLSAEFILKNLPDPPRPPRKNIRINKRKGYDRVAGFLDGIGRFACTCEHVICVSFSVSEDFRKSVERLRKCILSNDPRGPEAIAKLLTLTQRVMTLPEPLVGTAAMSSFSYKEANWFTDKT